MSAARFGPDTDRFLEEHTEDLLALTAELISIDSQIPPYSDERAIVARLQEVLSRWGLPRGEVLAPRPERPSLIVRIPGSGGGPSLMLCGHVDTKPIGDARELWRTDPLQAAIIDGDLYGLGANDMKGAVAGMILAAAAMRSLPERLPGDLVLALVADEEGGAAEGAATVAPQLRNIDAALIGEPSGWQHDWQGIHLVSRGVCCFRIIVSGTQMHSSLSDRMPGVVSATQKAAQLLVDMTRELEFAVKPHRLESKPTLNAGVMISGGTFFGVVPGRAEILCDLRTIPGMTHDQVASTIETWLDTRRAADPELQVQLEFEPGMEWIPPSELPEEHPLVPIVQFAAREVLGETPPLSVFPGGTDAPWFSRAGIPTLPSFGPGMLTSAHGPNEFVSVKSLLQAAKMYARVALDYCGASRAS